MRVKMQKFKTEYSLSYMMLLITPLVDTANGLFLILNGATGLSLGTFYRLGLLLYFLTRGVVQKSFFQYLITVVPVLLIGIIKGLECGELFGCITYAVKWILPIILICYFSFVCKNKEDIFNCLQRCIDVWGWYVPISLIVEYYFNIGYTTYYDAGFKGLYYSTNDIAFVLVSLYIYVAYRLFQKISILNIVKLAAVLLAILVLGTKSCIIFSIITICYFTIKNKGFKKQNLLYITAIAVLAILVIGLVMKNEIARIVARYTNMWIYSQKSNLWDHFFMFATSGRTDSIVPFFSQLSDSDMLSIDILFGWIIPDNAHVIEMDFHDLFCQYGIVGFLCVTLVYISLILKCKKKIQPYWFMVIVGFVYAYLAGHVISGALSGTMFAVNFSMLILVNIQKVENDD